MVEYNLGKVVGTDGKGIDNISKTSTTDNIDTYTIFYTNGEETTFTVTNGLSPDIVTSWESTLSDSKIPSEKLVKDSLDNHTHTVSEITDLDLTGKVNTSDIANNLTTTTTGKVLDARQGKILADLIGDAIDYINL